VGIRPQDDSSGTFSSCPAGQLLPFSEPQYETALYRASERQSQSHIATDGQSVSMSWCRAQIWDFWPENFFRIYCLVIFGAPSLTRGRVCHVSVFVIEVYSNLSLSTKYLHLNYNLESWTHLQYNKIFTMYTGLVQSRLCTADYALLTSYLVYHGSLRHLNSHRHRVPEFSGLTQTGHSVSDIVSVRTRGV
jgi:hypothetical protein